jgi:hypothetical protein
MPLACGGVVFLGLRCRCRVLLSVLYRRYGRFSAGEFEAENREVGVLRVGRRALIICP